MENRRMVGKGTHCKLDYLRGKDGSSRCGCHCCSCLESHNVDIGVKGDKNVTWRAELLEKKWQGVSVLFVYTEQTTWALTDLQNLVAITMERRMVVLEGDLQWQQACKAVWAALGLCWYSCSVLPSLSNPNTPHTSCVCPSGLKEGAEAWIWLRKFNVHIQILNQVIFNYIHKQKCLYVNIAH